MEGKWAILNNEMIVVALLEGNPMEFDITSVERYGGEIKYSEPFEHRGTPIIGSVWNGELNKFQ